MRVEESLNVTFDETPPPPKTSPLEDDDLVKEEAIEVNKTRPLGNDVEDKSLESNEIINIKEYKSHPLENVIGLFLHAILDRLCRLAILCLNQHAHTLHHLESLLTISIDNHCLDNLDILKEDLEYQSLRKSLSLNLELS
ncbi:hypothetical protein Tco_0467701 [Tanacetum coccineum]